APPPLPDPSATTLPDPSPTTSPTSPPPLPVTLQPGNSTVRVATLITRSAILFPPATYNLSLTIDYEVDAQHNEDSAPFKLNVRAPLKAIIYGSIIGSIVGFALRSLYEHADTPLTITDPQKDLLWVLALFGNMLLGGIVIVAFARKKDYQP